MKTQTKLLKTFKDYDIFVGFDIIKPTNGDKPYATWYAEGLNKKDDDRAPYLNSAGRTWPTMSAAVASVETIISMQ